MFHHRLPCCFLALLPLALFAQADSSATVRVLFQHFTHGGPAFLSAQDSLDFAQFKDRCARAPDTSGVAFDRSAYRLVWHEQNYQGFWTITRVSGQTLKEFHAAGMAPRFPFRSPHEPFGPRCAAVVRDPPMGSIQRDVWYFEAP